MTTHATSLLDGPAMIPQVRELVAAGVLNAPEARELEQKIRRELPWRRWLDHGLLAVGAMLIVAGVGYFFAHNWDRLTDAVKLGLAGGAVLTAFGGAMAAGTERFAGKLLLLAASALVGAFLAVFGQVYQSDAGSYELLRAWALLILPWVLLGRFVPLWLFWLGLVNGAVLVCPEFTTTFWWTDDDTFRLQMLTLSAINLVALAVREWAGRMKVRWLDSGWSREALLAAALLPATTIASREIFAGPYGPGTNLAVLGIHAALIAGLGYYFFRKRPSLPGLTLVALSTCWVLAMLVLKHLPSTDGDYWLVKGLLILDIFGAALALLRAASRAFSQQAAH